MSVRPPQAPDRLSSLSSALGDSPAERRAPGPQRQPPDASASTGLVQRCVIIQRDQHGFGFTVSGDRVVLVQSVRPGGAAMRAGVQEGDRILKVNGTMVTNSSHLEVVKLIKSGAYVALTLLGSPPGPVGVPGPQQEPEPPGCAPGAPQRITEPRPLQDPEVQKHAAQILRNMLRQEEAEYQRFQELLQRQPGAGAALEEQLEGARRRLSQLQLKVLQEARAAAAPDLGSRPLEGSPQLPGRLPRDPQDGNPGLEERGPALPEVSRNSGFSEPGSPRSSPVLGSRLSTDPGSGRPQIIGPEEDCEPGNGSNESDSVFQDLGILKSRPAHLGVFLRFLFSQADPTPLLFHLCSEVCCQQSPRDGRALARDIWGVFLDRAAPLRVKLPEQLLAEIELRLRNGDELRPALLEAQELVIPEIQEQLQDYRTKRTLGLGSLYGENELQELELGNGPRESPERRERERLLAERQLGHLGDILSKYEEERSSPMAFALSTFMAHAGIRPRELRECRESRECRNPGAPEKLPDKDKWLPFFPKAKKSSSSRKEKEQRQNPILKYIGKPRSSSQSTFHVPLSPAEAVRPGNVRTMIQHFENSHGEPPEPGGAEQRLSTGSVPEELLDPGSSSRCEVRLGRSESLKGREELRRSRRSELVPRSRSDVDMDAGSDTPRLHSASSSASSLSNRSLENPTPPYTPKMGRRSMDSPSLGFGADAFLPHLLEDEQGPGPDLEPDPEAQSAQNCQGWQQQQPSSPGSGPGWQQQQQQQQQQQSPSGAQSWQHSVSRELLGSLSQREVDRQEVINELFVTELSHLRILRVLDLLFFQRLRREQLLSREELGLLFPNLPDLIDVHSSLWESMRRLREEQGPIIGDIGDLMLARFEGAAKEEFQRVAAAFCSSQSIALELIRTKQRKESRFQLFMQEAESNPQCRRLQLKDLLIAEMQRLTKYPLLLENVIKCTPGGSAEQQKLLRAREQSRDVLRAVNEAVRRAENRQRLQEHQRRLDTSALERTSNPLAAEFRNLDLTSHRMIHEGPLAWRVGKDKSVELHVLLLEELLVLLQRQDERWLLKCHSRGGLGGAADTKQSFSPVLKLSSLLVRSVATDKRALFIICTSELGPQIYELVALTSSEKNTWMQLLEQAVQGATRSLPGPPKQGQSEGSGNGAASLLLPDPAMSPELARDTEPEDCSSGGSDPEPSGRARPLQELLEEPRGARDGAGDGDGDGDRDGAGDGDRDGDRDGDSDPDLGDPDPDPDPDPGDPGPARGDPDPIPGGPNPAPGAPKCPGSAGVLEAALEDVEALRLLIVRRLRPGRDPDPEDGQTPMAGAASGQDSDPRGSGREFPVSSQEFPTSGQEFPISSQEFPVSSQEFPTSSQEFPVSSQEFPMSGQDSTSSGRDSGMSSWEFPGSGREFPVSSQDSGMSSQEFPVSSQDSATSGWEFPGSGQEGPEGPEPNGIRINRKAQEEGPEEATPLRGCSQSEPELREGGGASAEGNFFYLSLPTGSPRPGGDTGDSNGDTRDTPGDIGDSSGDTPGDTRDTQGDTQGDTELILGTLEKLRGKLLSLRAPTPPPTFNPEGGDGLEFPSPPPDPRKIFQGIPAGNSPRTAGQTDKCTLLGIPPFSPQNPL
ncbi:rho guanine nucleotide exchange factor 11-like isoform X11 [Agelaius tricolor]|uniref:rho guanine nucleotide exchange factor 11-like isoform X11 n=1 Tax=Agelaius tricolor TaxID=9191 RepID=UPI0039F194AD